LKPLLCAQEIGMSHDMGNGTGRAATSRGTVLVADDETELMAVLCETLEEQGLRRLDVPTAKRLCSI
jgi:hypothetical protein